MSDKYFDNYRIPSTRLQKWDYRWNGKYFITICTHTMQHYFGEIINQKMVLSPLGVLADVFWHEIKNHAKNVTLDAFVVMPNHVHGILILNNPFDYSSIPDYSKKEIKIEKLADDDPMKGILEEVDENYWEYLKSKMGNGADSDISDLDSDGIFDGNPDSNPDGNPDGNSDCSTDRACPVSTPMPGSIDGKSPGNPDGNPNAPPQKNSPGNQRYQNIGKNSISSIIGSYKSAVSRHAHRLGFEIDWKERFHDHIIHNNEELKRIRHYINNNPKNWGKDKFRGKGGSIHGK